MNEEVTTSQVDRQDQETVATERGQNHGQRSNYGAMAKPITAAVVGTVILGGILLVYKLWFDKGEPEDNRVPDAPVIKQLPSGSRFCINGVWYTTTKPETLVNDWWTGAGQFSVGRFFYRIASYELNGAKYSLHNLAPSDVSDLGEIKMRIPFSPRIHWTENRQLSATAFPEQMEGLPWFETVEMRIVPKQVLILEHMNFIPENRSQWRSKASIDRVDHDVSIVWEIWLHNDNPHVSKSILPTDLKILQLQTAINDVDWFNTWGSAGDPYKYKNRMRRLKNCVVKEVKNLIANTTSNGEIPYDGGGRPLWVYPQDWPATPDQWTKARRVFDQFYTSVFFGHGIQALLDPSISSPVIKLDKWEIPRASVLGNTEETENDDSGAQGPEYSLNIGYEEYPEEATPEQRAEIDARNKNRVLEELFAHYDWCPNPGAEIYYQICSSVVTKYLLNYAYWGAFLSNKLGKGVDPTRPVSTNIMSYSPTESRFLTEHNGKRYTHLFPGAVCYYNNLLCIAPWTLASYGYQSESGPLIPPIITGTENALPGAEQERSDNGDDQYLNDHYTTQPVESRMLVKDNGYEMTQAHTD